MPRSPSPLYRSRGAYDYPRRGGGDSYRYRDDRRESRYDRDRDRDRDDYGGGGRRYTDDRWRRSYSRSRSRSRSRDRDRYRDSDRRGGGYDDRRYVPDDRRFVPDERDRDRDRDRERRHDSPTDPPRRSTPEEGQIIASPVHHSSPSKRSAAGRSPLPPVMPSRRSSPPPSAYRSRDRSPDRPRDRDLYRPSYRDSLSPRRPSTRDLSPASSRSRSSRFASPEKRRPPPSPRPRRDRDRDSPVRLDSVDRDRDRDRKPVIPSAADVPAPAPAPVPARRPVPVAIPFGGPKPGGFRQPPSGPRSERMPPSGPSGTRNLYAQPPVNPTPPPVAPAPAPSVNSFASRPGSFDSSNSGPAAAGPSQRPSWAERRTTGPSPHDTLEDVKPKLEPEQDVPMPQQSYPQYSDAELADMKVKEEDARIAAELPELKFSFARAPWEVELELHFKHMRTLEQNTIRAQSAQRVATAMWSEAEAERLAAMERRRIADEQLAKASTLGVGVALL